MELIYQLLKLENGWRNKDVVCSVQAGGAEVFTMQVNGLMHSGFDSQITTIAPAATSP